MVRLLPSAVAFVLVLGLGCAAGEKADPDLGAGAATGAGGATTGTGGASAGGAGGATTSSGGAGGTSGAGGEGGGCVAAPELCNGLDDDCDGDVDEDCPCIAGDTQPCWSGDPALVGIGACKEGTQTCDEHGVFGACVGEVLPSDETCNAIDDDCDGQTDEELGTVSCGQGICQTSVEACTGGQPGVCVPLPGNATEGCDGLDDDCDGQIDEGCTCVDGTTQACYTGNPATKNVGACKGGLQTCVNGQFGGACVGEVTPVAETCNAVDDDCDGQTDEGNPGGGAGCNTGLLGVCSIGVLTCTGGTLVCVQVTQASAETCNNKDDDCDGTVDDGNPGGGGACNTGLMGKCAAGTQSCVGGAIVCTQNQQASPELCNLIDDDCDGATDEGNPGGGLGCTTGQLGKCAAGTTVCQGGAVVCNQNQQASVEICNGIDDDCDGQTDEGNPGGGGACNTGLLGKCAAGTMACQGGVLSCVQNQQASFEQCNGIDDDCDGQTDEGNPGGGASCSTGLLGKCAAGTITCTGAVLVCTQNQQPSAELCNNQDDDCDGQVDEGNPGGGAACSTGQPGICAAGTQACQGGSLLCFANQSPQVETCNGVDDDCDGQSDEGNPGGGAACTVPAKLGPCAQGQYTCPAGSPVCTQTVFPVNETAGNCGDGVDNDCDGTTDAADTGCCPHTMCVDGAALGSTCPSQPCVANICNVDPYCCTTAWDTLCVGHVVDPAICGSSQCGNSCPHAGCALGGALQPFPNGCNAPDIGAPCVADICAADPFCCSTDWDSFCVDEVGTVCGVTCP